MKVFSTHLIRSMIAAAVLGTSAVSLANTDTLTDATTARRPRPTATPAPAPRPPSSGPIPAGQADLIAAQDEGRGVSYIEVKDVVVLKNLPDDRKGLPHQKWVVTLANGKQLAGVYNIKDVPKLPIKEGATISMGGEYIYDRGGGLLHWLHEDDTGRRPNGYVEIDGVRHGALNKTGIYK